MAAHVCIQLTYILKTYKQLIKENVTATKVDQRRPRNGGTFDFLIWLHCGSLDRGQLLLNFVNHVYYKLCSIYNKHTPAARTILIIFFKNHLQC